jgi:hypothetical protein
MSIWLRINGYPATEIAAHTPVTWETAADGGSFSASWAFALTRRSNHQALRVGALVEVLCGPLPVWTGCLSEPDRTTWECSAYGLASAAKQYLALDSFGSNTRDVGVAITQAQASGWQASNPQPVSGTASGDATGNPTNLAALLDEYSEELGQRWGVDGQGRVFLQADPTTSRWLATPDASAFGSTDEDRASMLYGRFQDAGTGNYLTATAGSGAPQRDVDLTARGGMSLAQAQAILQQMLARDLDRPAWTNGVTLQREQIQTSGGTPAFLPSVRAGQMVRTFGLSYGTPGLANDVVIGKTKYTAGEDTIYVEPVNTAARTYTDVLAS